MGFIIKRRAIMKNHLGMPFMIHWPQKIKPQIIEKAFSQMDIAPTILDLLDANVSKNSFMGNSIFSKESPSNLFNSAIWQAFKCGSLAKKVFMAWSNGSNISL